ncbi:glycosyltransferase family 39 protein [Xylella taiwanensis]|uniref:Glycosyltransferase family 39 protein n=1 Tax=Xylella taiwanensis TaxID=1444770 RepID=Z9JJL6_9GAMM|nr:glycosyltransferase family 39 protein [Xylella taiwanensis]EWS78006.1 membrane protein [Xylella taiwanensis]MCD8456573.1 glycosyltransferase family 39 protein [Xylella taiwanensis]MCD8458980.1 glycosyltransferase family 39 protein [Xylella taiwanensis]MCD8461119.1 glycosyltransferase family 39 protein [Xylella taiwanensis]MCD8462822.1 glycosyltransferase family 39 protein [Xylella taiwanensis]
MQVDQRAYRAFVILWALATAVKLVIAARLPLFVDEAFYWQEGQHWALAYSDLPGMTAWLTRLGVMLGGHHLLALRLPFLVIAALLPWLVAHIATRWFGPSLGWRAGMLTLLMPLSATLGILALPDVPMALAVVFCLDAGARLLRDIDAISVLELATGLLLGALSHYRFIGVIGIGLIALLCMPQGRALLRDPRLWIALIVGALGWLPLLLWNFDNQEAGLRFQFIERHPWSFQVKGAVFLLIQTLLVTPLLAYAMVRVAWLAVRGSGRVQWRYFGLLGGISTLGIFLLGFFTDNERVSFHWTLPGYFALLIVVPQVLMNWPRHWRRGAWGLAVIGTLSAYGYYLAVSVPALRERSAGRKYYPRNFAGWDALAEAVRAELMLQPGTRILAGNFKVGAELGFRLRDPRIEVLASSLNDRHGRTAQMRQWGLLNQSTHEGRRLLVLSPSDMRYRDLLQHYHEVCAMVGPLPPPQIVSTDHGYQRFLLFRLPVQRTSGQCVTPAMAWIDQPLSDAVVSDAFQVTGWAFKDGVGLAGVDILLDGQVAAQADYGLLRDVRDYWRISTDPSHPRVGFRGQVNFRMLSPGRHWLGLRLHGRDGSVEDWTEQPLRISR